MVFNSKDQKIYVDVAVAFPADKSYTYSVPEHFASSAQIGKRVLVPFSGRLLTGYIIGFTGNHENRKILNVLDIPDEHPLFPASMTPFFKWMAEYYMYPPGEVISGALPGGLNVYDYCVLTLEAGGEEALLKEGLSPVKRLLLERLREGPCRLRDLIRTTSAKTSVSIINTMEKDGWISKVREMNKQSVSYKKERILSFVRSDIPNDRFYEKRKALLDYLERQGSVSAAGLRKEMPEHYGLLNYLAANGYISECYETVPRDVFGESIESDTPPELTDEQSKAVAEIESGAENGFSAFLLSGVTGSGKTEVYMKLADMTIRRGLGVIVLVPEIALISQTERRFRARFGERVAVLHSGLSRGERFEQWMRLCREDATIAVGARSAVFAPLDGIGLIIVDEEHDSSYKQETLLHYNARDMAVVRAKLSDCPVILGSATPSVQSCYNVRAGKYKEVVLKNRIRNRPLPDIEIVDLRKIRDMAGIRRFISPELEQAMKSTLENKEQVLLFLNRRGFATFPVCAACREPMICKYCDITLTLHKSEKRFKCHLCDYSIPAASNCPTCGSAGVKLLGYGTEKIESAIRSLFPDAKTARMDRDTTSRKGSLVSLLKDVQNRNTDILVGTQMIAKGHDFSNITLAGIICADVSLSFPDFHSGERTFQLLAQVAGRSGRGDSPGKVILQTFNPDHFCILSAKTQDVNAFYDKEIQIRRALNFPPFSRMAQIRISGKDKEDALAVVEALAGRLHKIHLAEPEFKTSVQILGPVECSIFKLKNRYRWRIQLKFPNSAVLHDFLQKAVDQASDLFTRRNVKISVDIDPCFLA